MSWLLIATAVFGAWALLSTLGHERQRRLDQVRAEARIAAERNARAKAEKVYEA